MNDWGEVRFVSYLPTYDTLWEDVSFVLAKDNQIVYHFPAYFENNSTENDNVGMFDSVEAVGFQDIDGWCKGCDCHHKLCYRSRTAGNDATKDH